MRHDRSFRRIRIRFAVAVALSWLIPIATALAEHYYFDPRPDYADAGIEGPFEAIPDGIGASGQPRYLPGQKLPTVQAGQTFTWRSSVCLEEGLYMLARTDLVRLRDGATVVTGREVMWTPADRRCGTMVGSATVPAEAEPGDYEQRRIGQVRPLSWLPLNAPLRSLRVQVVRATKP